MIFSFLGGRRRIRFSHQLQSKDAMWSFRGWRRPSWGSWQHRNRKLHGFCSEHWPGGLGTEGPHYQIPKWGYEESSQNQERQRKRSASSTRVSVVDLYSLYHYLSCCSIAPISILRWGLFVSSQTCDGRACWIWEEICEWAPRCGWGKQSEYTVNECKQHNGFLNANGSFRTALDLLIFVVLNRSLRFCFFSLVLSLSLNFNI